MQDWSRRRLETFRVLGAYHWESHKDHSHICGIGCGIIKLMKVFPPGVSKPCTLSACACTLMAGHETPGGVQLHGFGERPIIITPSSNCVQIPKRLLPILFLFLRLILCIAWPWILQQLACNQLAYVQAAVCTISQSMCSTVLCQQAVKEQ